MSYTIKEARAVLEETKRILATDARRQSPVTARAAATPKPPTARELFFGYLEKKMGEEGFTKTEAIRAMAAEKPDLLRAFNQEANKERLEQADREKKEVARARANRNRR